ELAIFDEEVGYPEFPGTPWQFDVFAIVVCSKALENFFVVLIFSKFFQPDTIFCCRFEDHVHHPLKDCWTG
ncbi:unnamed protein product, partial [Haemonchus placei]|uniref:Ion_trans domain-containing protein n=1 Tax=Haemonchus placei TaxID=6290 RepID=A0A0N4WZ95_HAEPC